ncbi:SET domain protein [Cordyceps fumosorosea ARSEF 2679]|uniref:SET domain protein n=1 Tax=Cordyceps fumosorosea (strain ARSEF 2679) TaxID=1081104 RepID=A0A167T006_CORFA|nr:SET domain protein [Cordyceps fumosorosea ARSEF 2679]OAA60106.1 SET domain protein [Cordyceps fumosorosea ARSEF 2679]
MLPLLLESESSVASSVVDAASNLASSSSTPPTTAADSDSLHSDAFKHDIAFITEPPVAPTQPDSQVATELVVKLETTPQPEATAKPITEPSPEPITERASEPVAEPASEPVAEQALEPVAAAAEPSPKRARRSCAAAPVYNLSRLSGTDGHGKRRANGDDVADRRRRTFSGDTLLNDSMSTRSSMSTRAKSKAAIDALDLGASAAHSNSPRATRRLAQEAARSRRLTGAGVGAAVSSLGSRLSKIGKRGGNAVAGSMSRLSRELLRLRDTNEFSHIDDRPVIHTVWANGKYVDPNAPPPSPPQNQNKAQPDPEEEEEEEPVTKVKPRGPKKFLPMGLYAGQTRPTLSESHLTPAERKKLDSLTELDFKKSVNVFMPAPMYMGMRLLIQGRDFKLPFHVCNPLPPGQPKPDEWKKMTKNRFIGNSKDYWRKSPHYTDYSKCVCKPEDGCGDNCQNRIMLYECNDINCNAGKETCTNRAFATLTARRAKGGKYRVGVEVIKTSDRGYGVRSNRCFQPHQIIMEYTGEIITEEECDRRMKNEYKNNECYYLMSFDQNMIIDATTGSIARFVNHSCNPNCRMIKWIVSGQPRMALFAGDKPIMTGDELTYDYNFDPFSAKNVQKCLCGSENCRGVLGPRPREPKAVKAGLTKVVKGTINAGKRKLKEMLGDETSDKNKSKKRKLQPASGIKASLSSASLKAAKGAATAAAKPVVSLKRKITVKRMSGPAPRKQLDGSKKRATILSGRIRPGSPTTLALLAENAAKKTSPGRASAKGTPRANRKSTPKGTPNGRRSSVSNTTKGKTTPKGKVTPKTANRRLSGKPKQVAKPTIKLVEE